MTRDYEAILIARPEAAAAPGGLEGLKAQFAEILGRHQGRLLESADLGKRKLAYKIKKAGEGAYLQVRFQMPPSEAAGLKKASEMIDSVLRFFLVKGVHGAAAAAEVSNG